MSKSSSNNSSSANLLHSQPLLPHSGHSGDESQWDKLQRLKNERLTHLRPLNDFFDRNRISRPKNFQDVTNRLNNNLVHFQTNYAIVVGILLIYVLFTNLWLAVTVAILAGGMYYIPRLPDVVLIANKAVTHQQLYTVLGVASIPLLWISAAGSAIFWLVGASAVLILGHASLLEVSVENDFIQQV